MSGRSLRQAGVVEEGYARRRERLEPVPAVGWREGMEKNELATNEEVI